MRRQRFGRRGSMLDNLALVPASLLPFRDEWQRVANDLPAGNTLFVVPNGDTPLRRSMQRVAAQIRSCGRNIAAVEVTTFSQPR